MWLLESFRLKHINFFLQKTVEICGFYIEILDVLLFGGDYRNNDSNCDPLDCRRECFFKINVESLLEALGDKLHLEFFGGTICSQFASKHPFSCNGCLAHWEWD